MLVLAGALVLGVATPAAGARDPEDGPGPLPWRVTGPIRFTVDAASFPDSAQHTLEAYVRIPPTTLRGLAQGEGGAARLRLAVRLRNRFGAKHHDAAQEFTVSPEDSAGFGKVVVMRFPVAVGTYTMRVELEDLLSRKRGLAYIGRTVHTSSTVEGEVTVPGPQAGREISDLKFGWGEASGAAQAAFRRGQDALLPNPERLYGLLANELRATFVARAQGSDARLWHWNAKVLNSEGKVVAERESTATAGVRVTETVGFDISTEPAGRYALEVKAWQEGDAGAVVRRAPFDIAWQAAAWSRDPVDLEDAVHFLLDAGDEDKFAHMGPGERERYLEDFWRRRDPTPDTAENEAQIAFAKRIEYANRTWGRFGLGKGMFSDMGRVYIRHGEPDEVLKQVIPTGDQTLLQVLRDLELSEVRPTGDVHQKGLGGDVRSFEVWIYEGRTGGLSADALRRAQKRIVFLFVDEQGYGDFTLRYTTE
jgi:GWxTD domain-containing protein